MQKVFEDGSGEPTPWIDGSLLKIRKEIQEKIAVDQDLTDGEDTVKKPKISKKRSSLKTWALRGTFSVILIAYFCLTVYSGPILIIVTTIAIQVKCFKEIINVAYNVFPMHRLPWFRFISWYFLIAFNYFFCGENLVTYFSVFIGYFGGLRYLITCHRFISFCIYFLGVIWFVLNLGVKYDKEQFALLAWTHVALIILVTQSYMIVKNIFQGMIWLIVPVTSVVCNDIMAYVCGNFLGKTPLIKLSPKKTWEGFIGGGIFTILYGYLVSFFLCKYHYFVCPMEYKKIDGHIRLLANCEPGHLFQWTNAHFDFNLFNVLTFSGEFYYYPFMIHSLSIALFSSFIAPFGGFFASGFKRAFKVKDFGSTIPGHGGITDRFDCQFLMATFVNVYITSFIKNHSVESILERIYYMKDEQQVQLFEMLEESLKKSNVLT